MPVFRRHSKSDSEMHFGPALNVVSGNYVAAKRRGILDGVDFGFTGEVRFIIKDAIKKQLDNDNIVLLSNLGERHKLCDIAVTQASIHDHDASAICYCLSVLSATVLLCTMFN